MRWDDAVREKDAETAAYWAKRHQSARADERDANERANQYRTARDEMRAAFEASAAQVRKLRSHG